VSEKPAAGVFLGSLGMVMLVIVGGAVVEPQCSAIEQTNIKPQQGVANMTLTELREQRKEMAWRKRRIIFNNDGDDLMSQEAGTAEGLLKARTTALLDSQVDAIWYYSTWGMKLHHQDGPFGRLYGCPDPWGISTRNFRQLMASEGKDALEVMIETAHAHDLEIFYSNRLNDWHDSFNTAHLYDIRREHPEWSLSTEEEGRKYEYPDVRSCWSVWDFEQPEIRDLTVDALGEVCQTYDLDGIEMDFLRGTVYFAPTMELEPVEQKHLDMMNDMMRQIRVMSEEEGLKRGRPILIAARCVDDLELSRSIGLDVETWLEEGLIDILQIGHWTDMTIPAKPLIDLAHRYEVPANVMVNCKPRAGGYTDRAMWRGDALTRWWEGSDGIYTYNIFDPTLWLWHELGNPEQLKGLDHSYVWDYLPSQRRTSDVLAKVRLTRFRRPVTVTTEGCEPMPLFVGEDLSVPPTQGEGRSLTLRIYATGVTADHKLVVKVNGETLQDQIVVIDADAPSVTLTEAPAGVWLAYHLSDGAVFRSGENLIEAALGQPVEESATPIRIEYMRLDVDVHPE